MAFGGENPDSYHDEGLTAAMRGDLEGAVKFFEKALQLDRSHFASYHQLGKCYLRMGKPDRAAKLLRQVIAVKPNLVPARVDLGYALLDLGESQQARQIFEEVIAHRRDARALLGVAYCDFHEGQWASATAKAQAVLDQGGANFSVLYLLGRAARLAGRLEVAHEALTRADKLLEKSIESNPESPEGYYLRGELNFAQGMYPQALDAYRSAEDRTEPNKNYAAFGEHFTRLEVLAKRGLCLRHIGKPELAREVGEQILKIDPEHKLGKMLRDQA